MGGAGAARGLVGRERVLARVRAGLEQGGGVLLTGPSGIGKTTILDAIDSGGRVLRATAAEAERWISGGVLAELLAQVPSAIIAALPEEFHRAATEVLVGRRDDGGMPLRHAWHLSLLAMAAKEPVLVLLDDAQWVDAASADVIAYAARRVGSAAVRTVVAGRLPEAVPLDDDGPRAVPPAALAPGPVLRLEVPPLSADDLAELLDAHGLPARTAAAIHADSAGNPYLALILAGAATDRDHPPNVAALVRERLAGLTPAERETVLWCALASRPTVRLLLRAGRAEAVRDIARAAEVGLVVTDADRIRFTPPAAATMIADLADAGYRAAAHTTLAEVVSSDADRERHRALASADPDAATARALVVAAETAQRQGSRDLAAELYLLAADRTPRHERAQRLEWLVAAAQTGAVAARQDVVRRAADAVLAADSAPLQRVRVRMSLIHLAGQGVADEQELFALALADAGDCPRSGGLLWLWRAWAAMINGWPAASAEQAGRAVELARSVGDTSIESMALATIALMRRLAGDPDFEEPLRAALVLPPPDMDGWLHFSPASVVARFAALDDRLEDARAMYLGMLGMVERGAAEELVNVLRGLTEVAARLGRCREAMEYAARARRIGGEARLSPAPGWHTSAVAELAGGSVARAVTYAERGVRAAEQDSDLVFLRRHLHLLGQALVRTGRPAEAVVALRRIPELEAPRGIRDPTMLRWHADLATALVSVGEHDEAADLLSDTRDRLANVPEPAGVSAQLDRAEASLLAARGDADGAVDLLLGAESVFTALGQPLETGHCLLVRGRVERGRRRYAAAREPVLRAAALFAAASARPWADHADHVLTRLAGAAEASQAPTDLTATESRIAALVAEGASNREIADRLFISVKTVEASLTRVYRKLGIRSRTQLAARLHTD
ncbi:helix-turn-helix transcriptional regulator [Actinokineospora globicatena]|uniref:helix-turn-helix transcriptional regulator n=1 Tax=Actinokineospora globicatena TaxID=103729 RepID=UPI0020A4E21A|nr:LuxR family transcriptional regulator [Actinokineospora globicatena]MCP2306386.1 regulatory protein, luxR family [Actinokineospora globicatena]GLW81812.1 transcriptional regulator [Actinokineospora globicatena]GLW88606.1 transcriptional regulator [Actinokineospora globicatena]